MARGGFTTVRGKQMTSTGRHGVVVSRIAKKPEPECIRGRAAGRKERGSSEGRPGKP